MQFINVLSDVAINCAPFIIPVILTAIVLRAFPNLPGMIFPELKK